MRDQYYSSGIVRCRPRRSKWGRPVLMLLVAAMVLWLMSGCNQTGVSSLKFQVSGLPAVAAYSPEAMVLSLIFGVVAFVAVFASRKAKRVHERALEESLNEGGKMEEEWSEYRKLFPKAAETAEATAARGMPRNQMGHALRACVDEGRMVGKLIASARGTMDEGDRDDMLRVAGERLGVMMEVLNLTREGLKVS